MVSFSVEYQAALDQITGERSLNLRDYELSSNEWKIAKELQAVLRVSFSILLGTPRVSLTIPLPPQIFYDVTQYFSRDVPSIPMVIPAMDHIEDVLSTNATSARYSKSIRSALSIGRRTLNKYYSKTDLSETYRIAMGMFLLG